MEETQQITNRSNRSLNRSFLTPALKAEVGCGINCGMDLCSQANEKAYFWACTHFRELTEAELKKTLTIYAEMSKVYRDYMHWANRQDYDLTGPAELEECLKLAFNWVDKGKAYGIGFGNQGDTAKRVVYGVRYVPEGCKSHAPVVFASLKAHQ